MSRRAAPKGKEVKRRTSEKLHDIEAAWLSERPDLDLTVASTLLRMDRANQMHELRLEAISRTLGVQTGELLVLLALRRSGKPYELRPTDLFRALLVTSGAMTKRVTRLHEAGFVLRVSANDDGRSELVRLTASGLALADRGIAEIARVTKRVSLESGLTKTELEVMDRAFRKLLAVKPVAFAASRKPNAQTSKTRSPESAKASVAARSKRRAVPKI